MDRVANPIEDGAGNSVIIEYNAPAPQPWDVF
jgi:hypothetical protein